MPSFGNYSVETMTSNMYCWLNRRTCKASVLPGFILGLWGGGSGMRTDSQKLGSEGLWGSVIQASEWVFFLLVFHLPVYSQSGSRNQVSIEHQTVWLQGTQRASRSSSARCILVSYAKHCTHLSVWNIWSQGNCQSSGPSSGHSETWHQSIAALANHDSSRNSELCIPCYIHMDPKEPLPYLTPHRQGIPTTQDEPGLSRTNIKVTLTFHLDIKRKLYIIYNICVCLVLDFSGHYFQ